MASQPSDTCLSEADREKCPRSLVIRAGSPRLRSGDKKYIAYLAENGINIHWFTSFSLNVSGYIGNRFIGILILMSILSSIVLGFTFGCNSASSLGCQRTVYLESRITFHERPPPPTAPTRDTRDGSKIEREQLIGNEFSLPSFQATIIFSAFILAFSRWMIENRQSAMSELFERKKEVNLLLLKDEGGVLQPLISAAVRPAPTAPQDTETLDLDQIWGLLQRAAARPGVNRAGAPKTESRAQRFAQRLLGGPSSNQDFPPNAEFLRQMFVYIELDNFELAFNRYAGGLLDPDQMYRAFEIMESRCLNRTFRYMATDQGLKYYTDSFHNALIAAIVRAEFLDRGTLDG